MLSIMASTSEIVHLGTALRQSSAFESAIIGVMQTFCDLVLLETLMGAHESRKRAGSGQHYPRVLGCMAPTIDQLGD